MSPFVVTTFNSTILSTPIPLILGKRPKPPSSNQPPAAPTVLLAPLRTQMLNLRIPSKILSHVTPAATVTASYCLLQTLNCVGTLWCSFGSRESVSFFTGKFPYQVTLRISPVKSRIDSSFRGVDLPM